MTTGSIIHPSQRSYEYCTASVFALENARPGTACWAGGGLAACWDISNLETETDTEQYLYSYEYQWVIWWIFPSLFLCTFPIYLM